MSIRHTSCDALKSCTLKCPFFVVFAPPFPSQQDAERKRQEVETALATAHVVMQEASQAAARVVTKPKMGRGGMALAKKLNRR